MVISRYLSQQKRQLQSCINGFLMDALVTTGKLAASIGIVGVCILGTGKYLDNAREPSVHVLRFLLLSDAVGLAVTAFWAVRSRADWREWSEMERSRSELMGTAFSGQVEALQQSSLLWATAQQTAFQWQMQQQFPPQVPARDASRTPRTLTVSSQLPGQSQQSGAAIPPALTTSFDPAYSLGTDPCSAIIAGVPGSGKGTTAANALQYFRRERSDAKVFVIDPKADPKEVGNWSAADVVWSRKIKLLTPGEVAEWFYNCLDDFLGHAGPKLLILDEGSSLLATLKQVKDGTARLKAFLAHITSMGDSESEYLWLLVQIVHAEDLGFSGGYRSMPRAIAIASPKNRQALAAFLNTNFVPKPGKDKPTINELMQLSPCGRAVFDGQTARWYPLAPLPNVCGYDRDSRSFEAGHQEQVMAARGTRVTVTESKPQVLSQPEGDLQAWWAWLGEQTEGVSVRQVQQTAPSALRFTQDKKVVSAAYVRSLFVYFDSIRFGSATDDGKTFKPRF